MYGIANLENKTIEALRHYRVALATVTWSERKLQRIEHSRACWLDWVAPFSKKAGHLASVASLKLAR
jgi:hypothetical protein